MAFAEIIATSTSMEEAFKILPIVTPMYIANKRKEVIDTIRSLAEKQKGNE